MLHAKQEKQRKELEAKRGTNPYAEGTRYYDMWVNNPYSWDKFTRERSFWDDLAESWGIRSGYQAAQDEWAKAQSEYDAQIMQIKGEDEYNSEQAKAARMRAAGINPDLTGLAGASEAGEFAQEQTSPDINRSSEEVDKILGFIGAIPKALTFAMSITQEGARTMGLLYDLKTKKIETNGKMMELANKFLNDFTFENHKFNGGKFDLEQISTTMRDQAENWALMQGFSKKEAASFANSVGGQVKGRKDELYTKFTKAMEARQNYGFKKSQVGMPKDDTEEEIMAAVGDLAAQMNKEITARAEANALHEENRRDYETSKDGGLQAEGENAESSAKKGKGNLLESSRKAVEEAHKKLDKYIQKGNILAITLDSALAGMQLNYLE